MKRIALLTVGVFATVIEISASSAPARAEWDVAREERPGATKPTARKIDLNSATVRELVKLPGIGREQAERVIQHRPYQKLDELIAKKVLSRKQFARIKEQIRVKAVPQGAALR